MTKDLQDLTVEESLNRAKKRIIEMMKMKIQLVEGSSETGLVEEVANTLSESDVKDVINSIKKFIRTIERTNGTVGVLNTYIRERLGYYNNTINDLAQPYLSLVKNTIEAFETFVFEIGDIGVGLKKLSKGDFNSIDDEDLNDLVKYISEMIVKLRVLSGALTILHDNGRVKGVVGQREEPLFERTRGFVPVINIFKNSLRDGFNLFNQYLRYFSQ